jgi:hypothetical protein
MGIAVACESFYDDAWMRGDGWIGSGLLRGTSRRSTRSGDERGVHDGWLYLYHIASSMTQTLKLPYSVLIVKYRQNTPLFHRWREEFRGEDAHERVWMRGFVVIRFPMRKALGGRILPAEPRRRRGDPENTRGEAGKIGSCRNSRRLILSTSAPQTCSHTSMVAFIECRQLKTTLAC